MIISGYLSRKKVPLVPRLLLSRPWMKTRVISIIATLLYEILPWAACRAGIIASGTIQERPFHVAFHRPVC